MIFPPTAWVLDPSALIQFKQLVKVENQWQFFRCLERMVEEGSLYICRSAVHEMKVKHPDAPGAWAYGVRRKVQQCYDPTEESRAQVMRVAGDVVDPEDEEDDADLYVIAQALDLQGLGRQVVVVTRDRLNYASHISVAEACGRLNISTCDERAFVEAIDCDAGELSL